mmetsp:Transcript_87266/g.247398  ORF Transcript_87266/g.247398 Transcript_87266/m.247398 type:complete len:213 (-) Transcript_87266:86-724(-)
MAGRANDRLQYARKWHGRANAIPRRAVLGEDSTATGLLAAAPGPRRLGFRGLGARADLVLPALRPPHAAAVLVPSGDAFPPLAVLAAHHRGRLGVPLEVALVGERRGWQLRGGLGAEGLPDVPVEEEVGVLEGLAAPLGVHGLLLQMLQDILHVAVPLVRRRPQYERAVGRAHGHEVGGVGQLEFELREDRAEVRRPCRGRHASFGRRRACR